jgi:acyl carrier protein
MSELSNALKASLKEIMPFQDTLSWNMETPILGAVPEFDSMAIVSLIGIMEDHFDIQVQDDELSADIFMSFGNLLDWLKQKLADEE